jgi:urease accessory protein UreF
VKNKSIMKKVMAGIVAGGMALSAGSIALAGTPKGATQNKAACEAKHSKEGFDKCAKKDPLKPALDKLVKAGTLTQEKEDKIISYMDQKEADRKAEMDKVKDMTEEQRKAYFEKNKEKKKLDIFTDLVNQGIITRSEAQAIKNEIPKFYRNGMREHLDNAVKSGTITQEEENKIIAYMEKKHDQRKAEKEKIKDMTEEQRKAYFENKRTEKRGNFFDELVSQGILTKDKADALKNQINK